MFGAKLSRLRRALKPQQVIGPNVSSRGVDVIYTIVLHPTFICRLYELCMLQARPIVELREQITPEMLELVQRQRLRYMAEGTRFIKYKASGQVRSVVGPGSQFQ